MNAENTTLSEKKEKSVYILLAFAERLWRIRLLRFLEIGAVNTLFSYLIYALLVLIGAHYSLATLISTILGVIFNFFTTGRIVFRSMDNHRFFRFPFGYADAKRIAHGGKWILINDC